MPRSSKRRFPVLGRIALPPDLADIAAPIHSALLTMEMQRGIVGDRSPFDELVRAATDIDLVPTITRLAATARAAGIRVVHCTARFRADLAGSGTNSPLLRAMTRRPDHILDGSPGVEICGGLLDPPRDLVCSRVHGLSPFTGTDLDSLLRHLGVTTVIATGVSVNLAVTGLCIEAVNLGYQVVLPVDAVAGFPADYARAVIDNTLSLVVTRTTVDELTGVWEKG